MANQDYRREVREVSGEATFTATHIVKVVIVVLLAVAAISVVGYALGWFGEAAQVTQQELGPKAMLAKYQWFKETSAALDAKRANIEIYSKRQESMVATYAGKPRSEWDRTDKEQFNQWEQELAGVTASYNLLAAEYNSAMAKANWAFANIGDLPNGADKAMPREYRTYQQ